MSTTLWVISNDGSSSNSTSATSGAPEPALSALVILTYSGFPAPTSSSVTQIEGWDLLNASTARPMPGTHAQNVTWVALPDRHDPPASTDVLGEAVGPAAPEDDPPLLPPQAARDAARAPTAATAVYPVSRDRL